MLNSDSFKKSLDEEYSFPCDYNFKFIIITEFKDKIFNLIPEAKIHEKTSKNGKYTSVTLTHFVKNSSEILYIYENASKIDGVISL
ncbi:MAG: DUF493 domain-containing protein [Cytophagales bacterium]|jgi:hypothetical protein|nr:DUF493 domain-containing protein [Cytophagales bacterium]